MSKVICICGKIASGKTFYSKELKKKENAVILSIDELTYDLINNEQGEFYNVIEHRARNYLKKKSTEIVTSGTNVILDWGFWTKQVRRETTEYFQTKNIKCVWHYIDIDDKTWHDNIEKRNKEIKDKKNNLDFYLDEGLMKKLLSKFEKPSKDEIDIWYNTKKMIK